MLISMIDKINVKLSLIFLLWWLIAVALASIWGLGWFFLLGTLRRVITFYPPFRRRLRLLTMGGELELEANTTNQATITASPTIEGAIIVFWVAMTIFVFLKANISLITILEHFQ